jgi:hypothetical protein
VSVIVADAVVDDEVVSVSTTDRGWFP